jgi:lipopolysaccharide export system permease protein
MHGIDVFSLTANIKFFLTYLCTLAVISQMKKIDVLVLKSYSGPLVATFFISLFILLMQFLWKYIDDLVGKGLEWYIIAELLFYASSTFVPLALPLAILLSSLMTFGNLGEHYELVAMKSSGISLRSIMKPLIVLSVAISIFAFYFSNNVLPVANLKFKSLLYDVRKKRLAVNIKEGIFYSDMEDFVIRVGSKGRDGNTIYNVMIYDHTEHRGNINVTVADSGMMKTSPDQRFLYFTLYNGYNYQEVYDRKNARYSNPFQRVNFKEQVQKFDLSDFALSRTNEELFKSNYQMLNIRQLNVAIDSLQEGLYKKRTALSDNFLRNYKFLSNIDSTASQKEDTIPELKADILSGYSNQDKSKLLELSLAASRNLKKMMEYHVGDYQTNNSTIIKHKVVWHKKFTLSFACMVLFFIGAPLGAIIRKGGLGLPAVVSVLFFVLYHIISMIGEKSALQDAMPVAQGMWLSSVILLPLGLFLTLKATTDAPIMDMDIWNRIFGWINLKAWWEKIKRRRAKTEPVQ